MSFLRAYLGDVLPVGSIAPEFTAQDDGGRTVCLSDLRGRPVVLIFYPGDGTPGCTKQLCELRDSFSGYQDLRAAVYGVNPQGTASHQKFREKYNLPFPLLVDRGGKIASLYQSGGLLARRTVYAIDAAGKIRLAQRGMPTSAGILAALQT